MRIRHLTLRNFPNVREYEADFARDVVFLTGEEAETVLWAIDVLTGGERTGDLPAEVLITAEVETEDGVVFVTAEQSGIGAYLGLFDVTGEYRQMIENRREERSCRFYPNRDTPFSQRLQEYRTEPDSIDAREVGSKSFFHGYVSSFIRKFQPICLQCGKDVSLHLSAEGEFFIASADGRIPTKALSKSERTAFEYHCFLQIQCFWREYKQLQDIHTESLPLLISGLPFLDDYLIYAQDLLAEREARTLEHRVAQEDVRGQRILPKLARERDDRDNRAVLVRCVIRDDDDRTSALLDATFGNAGQLRQPDFILLHRDYNLLSVSLTMRLRPSACPSKCGYNPLLCRCSNVPRALRSFQAEHP